jgi:hypothetical protein
MNWNTRHRLMQFVGLALKLYRARRAETSLKPDEGLFQIYSMYYRQTPSKLRTRQYEMYSRHRHEVLAKMYCFFSANWIAANVHNSSPENSLLLKPLRVPLCPSTLVFISGRSFGRNQPNFRSVRSGEPTNHSIGLSEGLLSVFICWIRDASF